MIITSSWDYTKIKTHILFKQLILEKKYKVIIKIE